MTQLSVRAAALAAAGCVAWAGATAPRAAAQCATCVTPTVAFAPVIAAPAPVVVAPRMGLFDRWRLRRWGLTQPVTTVAVAPTFVPATSPTVVTAGFAPTAWTAGFAPTTWTAGFAPAAPTLTAFAPLQRPVATTTFMVAAPASTCATCPTSSAVLMPVVTEPACSACTACAAPASTCSACSAATAETSFAAPASFDAPSSGCASCAAGSGGVIYGTPASTNGDPATPTPMIEAPSATGASYPYVPAPTTGGASDADFEAPGLIGPANDRQASAINVDVHNAVYVRPATASHVNSTAPRPTPHVAVDTGAWSSTNER